MKKYLKAGFHILAKPNKCWSKPIHIQLEPTNFCNLRCITCIRDKLIKKPKHMPLKDFKYIIDTIQPKKLTLSGLGEPFLHPKFLELVKYAKKKGVILNTTTNMTLPKMPLEGIVKSGLDLLKISVDASTPETFHIIRGEGKYFPKIWENIKKLNKIKQRLKSKNPSLRLQFVMTEQNIHEMSDFVKLAHEHKVDTIYFQPLELMGREKRLDKLKGKMTQDEMLEEIKKAERLAKKHKIITNISTLRKNFDDFWKKYDFKKKTAKLKRKCPLPWFSLYIEVDGTIKPCCIMGWVKSGVMGNIFKEDLMEIWNNKKYQAFRKAIKAGKRPHPMCENCVPPNVTDLFNLGYKLVGKHKL